MLKLPWTVYEHLSNGTKVVVGSIADAGTAKRSLAKSSRHFSLVRGHQTLWIGRTKSQVEPVKGFACVL